MSTRDAAAGAPAGAPEVHGSAAPGIDRAGPTAQPLVGGPSRASTSDGRRGRNGEVIVKRLPGREEKDPALYRRRRRLLEVVLAIAVPVAALALWQLAAQVGWLDPKFFPAPTRIWETTRDLIESGRLQSDTWLTSKRVLYGFGLGCVSGIVVAVALSMSRLARAALEPTLYGLYTVPKLALLPLLLLIFGIGESSVILLIAINCFFLVFIPALHAFATVPEGYQEVAKSVRSSRWQTFRHVSWPSALPEIFVSFRIAAGAAVLTVVAVEFVTGREGLGFLIWNSWNLFFAPQMYVGIVVVAVLGALFTLLVGAVGRRLTPWSKER